MLPKVSVITPVYNGEKYIRMAIDSLLSQSFQSWEAIIVDDGSTDSTPEILRQYTDARIKVIHQKNAGEAAARNNGLAQASGEYIAFLDADDFYAPDGLAVLSAFLDLHPEYGVIYSNGQICDSEGKPLMTLTEIRPGIYTGKILEWVAISSNLVTVPICTMTRRSAISDHGIKFDSNLVIGPDWDFWIQLAACVDFGYLDRVTCTYRVHKKNITRLTDIKKRKRDQIYGRLKVMKADWFAGLNLTVKECFFYDLLINLASGDPETQEPILRSETFASLPAYMRAHFLLLVSREIIQNGSDIDRARKYLLEAVEIEPGNRKIHFLLWCLGIGRWFAFGLIKIWKLFLHIRETITSPNYNRARKLQKMFGLR